MIYEEQMINDKIIHKVKDDLLKLFELNPKKIEYKKKLDFSNIFFHTATVVDDVYRNA